MKKYTILVVILLALACRMYHIFFPVAGFQAWRQADTAAIAKNYYENGLDILYPQIDWGGISKGYVETEFPLVPFLISLLYRIFYPADFWGRFLSALFSLGAIYGVYLVAKELTDRSAALWAAAVYAFLPLNIYYSRAVMPESMMLMCSVLGVYFFHRWTACGSKSQLLASAIFIALAALLKITSLYLGLPLLFLAWNKFGRKALTKPSLWLFAGFILAAVFLWYRHAHNIYLKSGLTFGIWDYGAGKWGNFKPLATLKFYNDIFFKSIAERHLTYAGFFLFLIGLFLKRKSGPERVFDWWLAGVVVYFCIVAVGNQVHEYYQLPFTLPASVFIGKACRQFISPDSFASCRRAKLAFPLFVLLCLIALPVLSFLRYSNFMEGEKLDGSVFKLGSAVQNLTAPGSRVIAVDEGDPVVLYRCSRKGWHCSPDDVTPSFLREMQLKGAECLIGTKEYFDSDERREKLSRILGCCPLLADEKEYFIVSLPSTMDGRGCY